MMRIMIITTGQLIGIAGGVERVLINLANEMENRGHEVVLVYSSQKAGEFYYPIHSSVKRSNLFELFQKSQLEHSKINRQLHLYAFKIRREMLRLVSKKKMYDFRLMKRLKDFQPLIRTLIDDIQPAVVISAWWDTSALIFKECRNKNIPLITMSHMDAQTLLDSMNNMGKAVLNACDVVQVLMPADKLIFSKIFPNTQVVWIPNIVPQYQIEERVKRENIIVNVARLDKRQKRQYLLIEAFARIADQFPGWSVEFWGDENGKCKYTNELKELICKYHLEDRVKLCGRTDDVLSVYRRASIFAFPSAYEGFGLAMAEAMSAGLPVVAYRSCPAVNELVRDGETGLLVDDGVDALAEGLKKLMEDQELRERMGEAAHESMKEFAPEKIWDQWETLMKDTIMHHEGIKVK